MDIKNLENCSGREGQFQQVSKQPTMIKEAKFGNLHTDPFGRK
jgi:hypothetical protein